MSHRATSQTAGRVRREAAALPEAARVTPFEEVFGDEGTRYLRILPKVNQIPSCLDHGSQHVYVKEVGSTERRINQSVVEDDVFWALGVSCAAALVGRTAAQHHSGTPRHPTRRRARAPG